MDNAIDRAVGNNPLDMPNIDGATQALQPKTEKVKGKGEGMSMNKGTDMISSFVENLIRNYKAAQKSAATDKEVKIDDLIQWEQAEKFGQVASKVVCIMDMENFNLRQYAWRPGKYHRILSSWM
jgi:hypothetical protein